MKQTGVILFIVLIFHGQLSLACSNCLKNNDGVISRTRKLTMDNITFSLRTGVSDPFDFQIKPNDVSFSIHLISDAKKYFYIYELIDPNGNKLITKNPAGISLSQLKHPQISGRGQILSPNGVWHSVFRGLTSLIVPNNTSVKMIPGNWKIRFAVEKQKNVQLPDNIIAKSYMAIKEKTQGLNITKRILNLAIYSTIGSRLGMNLRDIKHHLKDAIIFFESIGIELKIQSYTGIDSKYDALSESSNFPQEHSLFKQLWTGAERVGRGRSNLVDIFLYKEKQHEQ